MTLPALDMRDFLWTLLPESKARGSSPANLPILDVKGLAQQ